MCPRSAFRCSSPRSKRVCVESRGVPCSCALSCHVPLILVHNAPFEEGLASDLPIGGISVFV